VHASTATWISRPGNQSLASPGQVSAVGQVIPYPSFDPVTLSGDAALLVLSNPTTVAPVALATEPSDAFLYDGGTGTVISGWGVDDYDNDLPSSLLYGFDVAQSAGYCGEQAKNVGAMFDPLYQLCAVDAPSNADGTCHGDSGGPLLATVDHVWMQTGITSFGPDTCNIAQPGYFTRVDDIESWVESEVQSHVPTAGIPPTTPPSSPTPPVKTRPEAGVYRGRTSQKQAIGLTVDRSRTAISHVRFGFRLRCTRHNRMAFMITPGLRWKLSLANGLGFTARFYDRTGTQYRLAGTFSSTGAARGSLRVTWRTARYGNCRSAAVRWSASS
jgi:hypothetical protein